MLKYETPKAELIWLEEVDIITNSEITTDPDNPGDGDWE